MMEAEIAYGTSNPAILKEKEAIARHAGLVRSVGIDSANVPEAVDKQAAFGGGDHFFDGGVTAGEDEVHGRFAVFIGERKPVAGGLLACGFGGGAGIDEVFGATAIHELNVLAAEAFTIERRALLQRMVNVVGNGDVLPEELFAHAVVEAGALVFEGGSGKVVKKKADESKHGGGVEDYGVTAGGKLAGVDGEMRFFGSAPPKLRS